MTFDDLFRHHLDYVRKYRALGTFKYYKKNHALINSALKKIGYTSTEQMDMFMYDKLVDHLIDHSGKKNSKINDALSAFRTALNRAKIEAPWNDKLKDDTEPFIELSDEETRLMLHYVRDMDITKSNNLSWALAILLFLDTGVRLSELLDLEFKKVDFKNRMILLSHTKNGKKRYTFFGALSVDLLMEAKKHNKPYVMWNYLTNKRLNKRSLEHFFDKMNRDIETDQNIRIHPHRLRKTFAMGMLMMGCPVTTLTVLLGHSDIRQTMNYLRIHSLMAKEDYEKYYPSDLSKFYSA